jgi:hypothetical protein
MIRCRYHTKVGTALDLLAESAMLTVPLVDPNTNLQHEYCFFLVVIVIKMTPTHSVMKQQYQAADRKVGACELDDVRSTFHDDYL